MFKDKKDLIMIPLKTLQLEILKKNAFPLAVVIWMG